MVSQLTRSHRYTDLFGLDAQQEYQDLGCCDCPAGALEAAQSQALRNIIDLVNFATSGRHSIQEYLNAFNTASTAGKNGYRSPELQAKPACVRNAFNWIESNYILTGATYLDVLNLGLNPFSETPWFSFGDAFAGDEANRQNWLYQRLGFVQKRCAELKKQLRCPCPKK